DKQAVEDIYRLTELQEALLVHRLRHGDADSGFLLQQGTLRGPLRHDLFEAAWRATILNHPVLRSSVHWQNLKHPVQVVQRTVELPLTTVDWRQMPRSEQQSRQIGLVTEMQHQGLDITQAPVLRMVLLRLAQDEHRLLWACHHLLLDGWSSALVLREVLARYKASCTADTFEDAPSRPFRDYATWVRGRDLQEAGAELWEHNGFEARNMIAAPPLVASTWRGEAQAEAIRERRLTAVSQQQLEQWGRDHQLPPSSLFLGAWGLALAEATGSSRPVFGLTVSGRAAPFDGLDTMVGLFANALPLQVEISPEKEPIAWLRDLFRRQQALQQVEHCPLDRLLRAGGVVLRRPLFDSLLAHANFPSFNTAGDTAADDLSLHDWQGDLTSGYPLTLAIRPEPEIVLAAHYDRSLLEDDRVEELIDRFAELVETLAADSAPTLGHLLRSTFDPPTMDPANGSAAPELPLPAPPPRPLGGTDAEQPATPTEAQLMRIWNDLIATQEFGRDDNFFDLGGNSLLVPTMIARVRHDFGCELPLGIVFEAATVRRLAQQIDAQEVATEWPVVVGVRSRGARSPLYMVHGLGGEVGWFYNLANHLDPAIPLYGLQAPPEPLADLGAMAERYIEAIRQAQPHGPYRLGGYCIGGGVAYEMAQRLLAAGETIDLVILIDSVPRAYLDDSQAASVQVARRLKNLLAKAPRDIAASTVDFARRAARRLWRKLSRQGAEAPPEIEDVLDMRTLPQVYHHAAKQHFRAMRDWLPRPYDGDVHLFRTHDARFGEDFGWGPLVRGRLGIDRIEGRHIEVLREPYVQEVGRKLSRVLDNLDGLDDLDRTDDLSRASIPSE
ncbi:MAG: condensation domain-containing protein, partial [Acidobacteriota bacterium]